MGSEQSSENRKSAAATPQDVERALERQRRMYEAKMTKLLQETRQIGTTASAPPIGPLNNLLPSSNSVTTFGATKTVATSSTSSLSSGQPMIQHTFTTANSTAVKNAAPLNPLGSQHPGSTVGCPPQLASSVKVTAKSSNRPPRPPPPTAINAPEKATYSQDTNTVTICMDRQRYPYSYNQNELHGQQSPNSLYPSLNPSMTAPQGHAFQMHPTPYNNNNMAPYNKNIKNDKQQQPRYSSPQPSAPPREAFSTRSRSQSRQRDFDGAFNCVTCGRMYGERIYQCNQGHSSCDLCKTRQVQCGCCRQHLTDRRNFDLEKCIMEKKIQCPNAPDGCRLYIKMGDMAIHEKECPFKMLQCPSLGSNCKWHGKLSTLEAHFKEMHPLHNQGEVDKEMFISNIHNTNHLMHYIRIGPFNFLFHVKVSQPERRIYMMAQLIGTKNSAAKWEYEIHMYKKNEPRRKFQYSDKCSSTILPLQEVINSAACAVIPQEYASTYICGGSVAYKFYIKKDDDKTNDSENNNAASEKKKGNANPRRHNFKKYVKKNHVAN